MRKINAIQVFVFICAVCIVNMLRDYIQAAAIFFSRLF